MKYLKTFNENNDYLKSEDFYKDLTDRLFIDIDDHFKDKKRFFPLCVRLRRDGENSYSGSVCMGLGWYNRMNDEEQEWLEDKLVYYKNKFDIIFSMCGDSFGGDEIYNIENDSWPKSSHDYMNFPPDPFNRDE